MKVFGNIITKYYKYGNTVNVTPVGSPTISNGMVSGISSKNYLKIIPDEFPTNTANSWEMVFKWTHAGGSERQAFFAQTAGYETILAVDGDDTSIGVNLIISNAQNDNYLVNIKSPTGCIENGKTYWVKAEFTGSQYKLWLSTNGTNWVLQGSVATNTKASIRGNWTLGIHNESGYYYPFLGTIDLKHSYMKINGQLWWTGTQPEEATSADFDFTKTVLKCKAKINSAKKYFKYSEWTQPVLTSNFSSGEMWLEDPNKTGAKNSSDQTKIETWGSSAMKNFNNVYLALDSNTGNVFTLGASNATQATVNEQTYDVFDVCFSQYMKITHIKIVCKFQSGYHCALRRAMGYVVNDNGSVGTRLFNLSGNNDKLTLENDIGSNKTKRLRICLRPDWNNGSYSCQIQEITISAQKAVSGTSANNDFSENIYKYQIFNH